MGETWSERQRKLEDALTRCQAELAEVKKERDRLLLATRDPKGGDADTESTR